MIVDNDVVRIFDKGKMSGSLYEPGVSSVAHLTSDGAISIVESNPSYTEKSVGTPLVSMRDGQYRGRMSADVNSYFNSGKITRQDGYAFVINKKNMKYNSMEMFEFFYAVLDKMSNMSGSIVSGSELKEMSMRLSKAEEGKYRVDMGLRPEDRSISPHDSK